MTAATVKKPAYRVPLMAEVGKVKKNGFVAVSTFSGCGGSCLGFEMAGYRIAWASEFIDAARETYAANHRGVPVDGRDVRLVTAAEILKAAKVKAGAVDVLEGSPPCASFSTSGKRSRDWGREIKYSSTKQRVDDLFFEYLRLVDGVRPKVFVAENVSGLVKGVAKGYFKEILAAMKKLGYRVEARLLDAQWLGVPQQRQRIIFVGVRDDLGIDPAFPKPFAYRYSVRDAIPSIAEATSRAEANIERFAIGNEWKKLKQGEVSGKYLNLIRCREDRPSYTITYEAGNLSTAGATHPTEPRKFTIAELRRICSFPDDFVLTGSYPQQWERLGRAVPPLMMFAVASTIRDRILIPLREKGKR